MLGSGTADGPKVVSSSEISVVLMLATSISAFSLYEVAVVSRKMKYDDCPGISVPVLLAASKNWKLM